MYQVKLAFKKRSFLISLLAVSAICFADFVINCMQYFGRSAVSVPSAEKVFIWGSGTNFGALCLIYLLPIFAVLPFADSFIIEKEQNMLPVLLHRIGVKKYYYSKIAAVAATSFVVVVLPMLMNLLLCNIAFPTAVNDFVALSSDQSWYYDDLRMTSLLFPLLSIRHPFLMNLLSVVATGAFCSFAAVIACQLSYFINVSRVLILALFFIASSLVNLSGSILSFGNLECMSWFYHLIFGNIEPGRQIWYLCLMFALPIVFIVGLIFPCIKKIRKLWG